MKKTIRNILIGVAGMIVVMVLMPISFVKTSDRGATHDYFPEELKGRIKAETAGYSDEEIVKYSLNLTAITVAIHKGELPKGWQSELYRVCPTVLEYLQLRFCELPQQGKDEACGGIH